MAKAKQEQTRFAIISDGRGQFTVIDREDKNNELFSSRFAEREHAEKALASFLAEPTYAADSLEALDDDNTRDCHICNATGIRPSDVHVHRSEACRAGVRA